MIDRYGIGTGSKQAVTGHSIRSIISCVTGLTKWCFDIFRGCGQHVYLEWKELVPEGTKIKDLESTDQSTKILKAMLLGDSTHGFGPLIRKYYVDTTKKFPTIPRVV
ncbi:hypothetical protein JOF56_005539 [Kibdelosporangium banguiense]|uniref:Tn3 transposase DDE domain-containing protein n=1 Tax=Kibdelosporangium banguiense TaxID=1365924 RepID=A0ABS4TLE1_9PSEU|nr:hypothetical protein [Kibdelosporangium banguiense]MBP2325154.1 hypothetical protein [Kibdelosporangium banguiense]